MVECLPSKQGVASSNLVSRSTCPMQTRDCKQMNLSDLTKRTEQIIELGKDVLARPSSARSRGFRSAGLSFIERVYSRTHSHYEGFEFVTKGYQIANVEAGVEILNVIHEEIKGGWLFSLKNLLTAGIFTDFLQLADHLMENDYKDAAAVIAGSTLEQSLRELCKDNSIAVERESNGRMAAIAADRLNADLVKKEIYNGLVQKQVTSWLDLRNKAAHGHYEEYDEPQVKLMLQGITDFMARHSSV